MSLIHSALWQHLRALPPANRIHGLAPDDYTRAVELALTERDEFSGAYRHVALSDIAESSHAANLLDVVAEFRQSGYTDREVMQRGWAMVVAAYHEAANVVIDNRLRELRALRMAGARTVERETCVPYTPREDDHHAAEIAMDMREERNAQNEHLRDALVERRA